MTPRKPAQHKESNFTKGVLVLCTTGIISAVAFLWSVHGQLAEIKSLDRAREERVLEIKASVSRIEEEVKDIKEDGLQDIRDRLKTVEVQNDKK
jgi:hypothetical protein